MKASVLVVTLAAFAGVTGAGVASAQNATPANPIASVTKQTVADFVTTDTLTSPGTTAPRDASEALQTPAAPKASGAQDTSGKPQGNAGHDMPNMRDASAQGASMKQNASTGQNSSGGQNSSANQDTSGGGKRTQENLSPDEKFPSPVDDEKNYTLFLADVLELRPSRDGSDFRWDIEGWHGGDYNRVWYKSEGESDTAFKADYDIDFQLLYGRFVKTYYDFQIGGRIETQTFRGRNVTRVHAVVGLQGLVPYRYEIESALFIDQNAKVSARFSASRDYLITQRLILQPRVETSIAAQRVERFTTGRGLNNMEGGLRLRYEIRRQFAPYVGVSFDRSFFGTADLVRQDGGDPSQIRFAVGVRLWR